MDLTAIGADGAGAENIIIGRHFLEHLDHFGATGGLLAVKRSSAESLNSWSLETFFDRSLQFIWGLSMLLTWTTWPIALPTMVRLSGRAGERATA